jgi:hypothetical protein
MVDSPGSLVSGTEGSASHTCIARQKRLSYQKNGAPCCFLSKNVQLQTYYRWKKRYGGLGMSKLRQLEQLETVISITEIKGRMALSD